jgi:hypothetical protein
MSGGLRESVQLLLGMDSAVSVPRTASWGRSRPVRADPVYAPMMTTLSLFSSSRLPHLAIYRRSRIVRVA